MADRDSTKTALGRRGKLRAAERGAAEGGKPSRSALGQALRANLRRRKDQARARQTAGATKADAGAEKRGDPEQKDG